MVRPLACASRVLAALAALTLVAGCAASASSGSAASDIASTDLSAMTIVKGTVVTGQTLAVDYEPAEYAVTGLPYLGVTLDALDGGATARNVTIAGNFPGTPHVLLVDPAFKVLAEADGVRTADGAKATLSLPAVASAGRNMLLVQDARWNAPMSFDVTAE